MWYLYLDESGDLGFDFFNKKPSNFFTLSILAISTRESFKRIKKCVEITIRRKLRNLSQELKGSKTKFSIKKYFWKKVNQNTFGIYAITLNKRKVYEYLSREKDRVYNFMARQVVDKIPFEQATDRIQIVVDKSKAKREISEFNDYILRQLSGRIEPRIPLHIDHLSSEDDKVLQASDLFCWGIFRKYERNDYEWYDVFKEKVIYDDRYL